MPHLIIEHSANVAEHVAPQTLVDVVHGAALEHGLAAVDALRTRAVSRSHVRIADGHPTNAFVAITARIGPGRTAEAKTSFIEHVLDSAEAAVADLVDSDVLAVAWSIELQEIDPATRINRNHVRSRMADRLSKESPSP